MRDQRKEYERLVGVACAAVPKCYAAYRLGQEEKPDFSRLIEYLGRDSQESRDLQNELGSVMRWVDRRQQLKLDYLRRLSDLPSPDYFPRRIRNAKDDTVMILITDEKNQPVQFETEGKRHYTYVDVTEVTTQNFVRFLNSKGNGQTGGALWYRPDDEARWHIIGQENGQYTAKRFGGVFHLAPVINVSYFGAEQYCNWAGKALPSRAEWMAAARFKNGSVQL